MLLHVNDEHTDKITEDPHSAYLTSFFLERVYRSDRPTDMHEQLLQQRTSVKVKAFWGWH